MSIALSPPLGFAREGMAPPTGLTCYLCPDRPTHSSRPRLHPTAGRRARRAGYSAGLNAFRASMFLLQALAAVFARQDLPCPAP